MLTNVFKAQMRNPSKGDWIYLVKDDLEDFNISDNLDEISEMSEYEFKKRVAIACKKYSFKQLVDKKNEVKHNKERKGKNLEYNNLKIQDYLISGKL